MLWAKAKRAKSRRMPRPTMPFFEAFWMPSVEVFLGPVMSSYYTFVSASTMIHKETG